MRMPLREAGLPGIARRVPDLRMSGNRGIIAKLPIYGLRRERQHAGFPKRSKGADCKSAVYDFSGSNPLSGTPR